MCYGMFNILYFKFKENVFLQHLWLMEMFFIVWKGISTESSEITSLIKWFFEVIADIIYVEAVVVKVFTK